MEKYIRIIQGFMSLKTITVKTDKPLIENSMTTKLRWKRDF